MANSQLGTNYAGAGTSLAALIPIIYEARDEVAREQIGLITAASRDASEDTAALGQIVRSPVTGAVSSVQIAPGAYAPSSGGQTIQYKDLTISNAKAVPLQWTGEEQKAVGALLPTIIGDQFKQAFRSISNEIEASLVSTLISGASRAVGTAGTSPFNTVGDFSDFANAHLTLDNNGCPIDDRHFVMGFKAYANMIGKQSSLWKANEAGTDDLLRRGILNEVMGFKFHKSAQLDKNSHTKGTGAAYASVGTGAANGTVYQVGETAITLGTGTGTVLAGDVVTFAGDTHEYVVAVGVAAPGVITLAAPGLQQTLADAVALTIGASYTPNFVLDPAALMLATRMPLMPASGDGASDRVTIGDPVSGISFEVVQYKQYRQIHTEIGAAWGSLANKPEFAAIVMG